MSASDELVLGGLDGLDPLGFLAALGCLAAVTDRCAGADMDRPRLSFDRASHTGRLRGPFSSAEELLDLLVEDLELLAGRAGEPRDGFLSFHYPTDKGKLAHDLKPPPELLRREVSAHLDSAGPRDRRTVDWFSATLTDVGVDGTGNSKPFALHFTAGNQQFLLVAQELLDGVGTNSTTVNTRAVDREDLREAVIGPWKDERGLKVFSWSPTQDRAYALRSTDPAKDKKRGTPGADWLALRGLTLLSSAPSGKSIATGGVHGRWKSGSFTYPVWAEPLDADSVASLLRHPALRSPEERDSPKGSAGRTLPMGVEALTCRISRSDQGGYGAFSRPTRRPG